MNWGYRILVLIIAFLVAMFSMLYVAMQQSNEMLDENYYAKEINYQQIIDAKTRLNNVNVGTVCRIENDVLNIKVPESTVVSVSEGNIELLRLDSEKQDFRCQFQPNSQGLQTIDVKKFQKGIYKLRLSWKSQNQMFFKEENIFIHA